MSGNRLRRRLGLDFLATVDSLLSAFQERLCVPWRDNEPDAGRVWILWYPKEHERRIRGRLHEFRLAAEHSGKGWYQVDLAPTFGNWVATQPWFERAARRPPTIYTVIGKYEDFVVHQIVYKAKMCTQNDILAVIGVAYLFGLTRTQDVIERVIKRISGRLLVTFPGVHRNGIYRLLDARDGYNYLAVPIPSESVV